MVSLPTCSSPTTTATRSARRTPASASVSDPAAPHACANPRLTVSTGQVGKQLGDKWKALSTTERKPYDDKAAADKKRYEEEKAAYLAVRLRLHFLSHVSVSVTVTLANSNFIRRLMRKRMRSPLKCLSRIFHFVFGLKVFLVFMDFPLVSYFGWFRARLLG